MNATRFIAVSLLVTLAGIGLFLWLIFGFPDRLVPTDPAPTVGEYAVRCAAFVVSWPTVVIAVLFGAFEEPRGFAFSLLFIPSGLIWATIIELFLRLKRSRWPNKPAAPNPAITSRLDSGHHRRGVGEPERWHS